MIYLFQRRIHGLDAREAWEDLAVPEGDAHPTADHLLAELVRLEAVGQYRVLHWDEVSTTIRDTQFTVASKIVFEGVIEERP